MVSYDPWRHRYALVCAVATVVLLVAGGLVTSTGSGLAVPDWPLSFGKFFPPMAGGVLFEHGHRLVAATVGLMTFVLACWFGLKEKRPWVRRLAYAGLGAVVAQGLLGGLTVLLRLPATVSVAHACLAQGFFCVVVILALATSRPFVENFEQHRPPRASRASGMPVSVVAGVATSLVYAQLVLGAVMRHTGAGLAIPDAPLAFGRLIPPTWSTGIAVHFAHRVTALLIATLVLCSLGLALRRRTERPDLQGPAVLAAILVVVQILLGVTTVRSHLAVIPATAHVVTGALLLATCLVLTVRAVGIGVRRPHPSARGASGGDPRSLFSQSRHRPAGSPA